MPCMVHVMLHAVGGFLTSLGIKGCSKSWKASERNRQFGENQSTDIGKTQRHQKEANARISKLWARRSDLAKITEKVCNSRKFENPATDLHIAANTCSVDYADSGSSKRVRWLSNSNSRNRSTTYNQCENMVVVDKGVARVSQLIMRIHPQVD